MPFSCSRAGRAQAARGRRQVTVRGGLRSPEGRDCFSFSISLIGIQSALPDTAEYPLIGLIHSRLIAICDNIMASAIRLVLFIRESKAGAGHSFFANRNACLFAASGPVSLMSG
ncbi:MULTISPECIES: hypothetical protein [Gammaproteobacteria]|uniref:Uncharacterized protein n=1 Tax=Candidatus Macondimonas diazotrophica TaxID=2305248 RepID=A0A4Z0FF09_9GAMM|nr:hypothetical protein [Candidatus Macondimonas diazotrophica]TFZ84232.1 hypothetical protein E4680_01495 [Candidatus Macondimonas diazotrophica]